MRWLDRWTTTGSVEAKPGTRHSRSPLKAYETWLLDLVASEPDLTLAAALRSDGVKAAYVIDGAMDGPAFLAWVEQMLVPTLKRRNIVFMDNVRTHKVVGVHEAIEAAGAQLRYLPAYSPDLNPIENLYSKLKSDLSKGAARTVDALTRIVGRSLKPIAPIECAGYFKHAGYRT